MPILTIQCELWNVNIFGYELSISSNCHFVPAYGVEHFQPLLNQIHTFRSGFAISGKILQNGLITSRNLTEI